MITDEEFLSKEWPQNCGDTLRIIRKSEKKNKYSQYLWEAKFQKYSFIIFSEKKNIINGKVLNPQIEVEEFIKKEWPQNCGDTLQILEKTIQKANNGSYLFRCKFKKYPYELLSRKDIILKGAVENPQIEQVNFVEKLWPQTCGDILKIISKSQEKCNNKDYYWNCEFQKYPYQIKALKFAIIKGNVDNPALPWKSKEKLIEYFKQNQIVKISLTELANKLNVDSTTIGQAINQFELRDYIDYASSNEENELLQFCQSLNQEEISNKNFNIEGTFRELDIYFPNQNIGFEFNGNYWHSEEMKLPYYHQEKTLLFQKIGIKVFHIFEYEYIENKEKIQQYIKSKLGIYQKKIFARNCKLKEVSNQEYQQFCKENHLQNDAGAKVKLGLFYKDELVQVMSFGVPRFTFDFDWEIIRECSKLGYCVVGGKEKLWKCFIKTQNPKNCISYCDFSKFEGDSYLRLGFKKERLNKPGFVWWDSNLNQIFYRTPSKHQEYKDKYIKIYDAGQLVFTWSNNL